MGFRTNVFALLFLIVADCIFTVVRPSTKDYESTMNTDVLDYVLIAAHGVTVICQAVAIFVLFSSTIWFTAGLLGELVGTAKWTLFIWGLRFIFVAIPWVYRRFIASLGDSPMTNTTYVWLYVMDLLLAVALWAALMYTAGCMTAKGMYSPYHREFIPMPHVAYQQNVAQMQRFQQQQQQQQNHNQNAQAFPNQNQAPQLTEAQQMELTNMRNSSQSFVMRNSGAQPPNNNNTRTNSSAVVQQQQQNSGLGYDHVSSQNQQQQQAPPPGVG